jgi:hypothetical protein
MFIKCGYCVKALVFIGLFIYTVLITDLKIEDNFEENSSQNRAEVLL